jgi:cytochrome c-type biogenesis protein CcmH
VSRAAPDDAVFIFARAAQGPKMPLAVMRKQVKDLPANFALDDSMAMTPEMKLSNFPEIVIGARVAKSGNAVPQSGDLEGFSTPVKLGASGVTVTIDAARP